MDANIINHFKLGSVLLFIISHPSVIFFSTYSCSKTEQWYLQADISFKVRIFGRGQRSHLFMSRAHSANKINTFSLPDLDWSRHVLSSGLATDLTHSRKPSPVTGSSMKLSCIATHCNFDLFFKLFHK